MVRKGNITTHEMIEKASSDFMPFEDFKEEIKKKLNINVALTVITLRSDSYFVVGKSQKVPYLKLYTLKDSYEKIIGNPERMGLCSEEQKLKIMEIWYSICLKYNLNLDEYYDSKMYVGAERFETMCFSAFAYTQKEIVQDYLLKTLQTKPRDIFASSMPGVNIVYETADYERLNIEEKQEELSEKIKELAIDYVHEIAPIVTECNLKVTFYHPKMENYNGYGLARQD